MQQGSETASDGISRKIAYVGRVGHSHSTRMSTAERRQHKSREFNRNCRVSPKKCAACKQMLSVACRKYFRASGNVLHRLLNRTPFVTPCFCLKFDIVFMKSLGVVGDLYSLLFYYLLWRLSVAFISFTLICSSS